MKTEDNAYRAVLADLERKKAQIDNAIFVMRSLTNGVVAYTELDPTKSTGGAHDCEFEFDSGLDAPIPVDPNKIECEDIVTCVKVLQRGPGLEDDIIPKVGRKYRVIKILNNGTMFEVLDDLSDNKIRMPVYADEMKLERKRKIKPPKKVGAFEVILRCGCGEDNALKLDKKLNKYTGSCARCGAKLLKDRPEKAV